MTPKTVRSIDVRSMTRGDKLALLNFMGLAVSVFYQLCVSCGLNFFFLTKLSLDLKFLQS